MIITPIANRPVLQPCTLPDLNYQVDPYIGCEHYCYYCYVLPQAQTDWKKEIGIHANLTTRLKKELSEIPAQTIYSAIFANHTKRTENKFRHSCIGML